MGHVFRIDRRSNRLVSDLSSPTIGPMSVDVTNDRFFFRQLLSGRDFAREDPLA